MTLFYTQFCNDQKTALSHWSDQIETQRHLDIKDDKWQAFMSTSVCVGGSVKSTTSPQVLSFHGGSLQQPSTPGHTMQHVIESGTNAE